MLPSALNGSEKCLCKGEPMKSKIFVSVILLVFVIQAFSGCAALDMLRAIATTDDGSDTAQTTSDTTEVDPDNTTVGDTEAQPATEPQTEVTTESPTEVTTEPETQGPVIDYPTVDYYYYRVYDDIIRLVHELLLNADSYDLYETYGGEGALNGVIEAVSGMAPSEALESIGYAVCDINLDDIQELLIVRNGNPGEDDHFGSNILAAYTCYDNAPQPFLEGYFRSHYCYLGNGRFLHEGSGGVTYDIIGVYEIPPHGNALECNDFYFRIFDSINSDDSVMRSRFYHNTTGEMDESDSEPMDITDEQFRDIADEISKGCQNISIALFSEYIPGAKISAQWADDVIDNLTEYDVYSDGTSESQARMVFFTDAPVENFKLVELTPEYYIEDEGTLVYSVTDLYSRGTFTPSHPLVASLNFKGDLPSYGVSYTDADGLEKVYAVEISGEDGSLIISVIRFTCG